MNKIILSVAAVLFSTSFITAQVVMDGLISKYYFNGNAEDEHGTNEGTVYGATLVPNRFGVPNSAYNFDGFSGQYIDIGGDESIKQRTMSISMWINMNSSSTDCSGISYHPFIVAHNNNYPSTFNEAYTIGYSISDDKIFGGIWSESAVQGHSWNTTTETSQQKTGWKHVVFMWNDYMSKLYYNGVLVDESSKPFVTYYKSGTPVILGKVIHPSIYCNYNGKLDDIRIYNRLLTNKEVYDLYTETPEPTSITNNINKEYSLHFDNSNNTFNINNGSLANISEVRIHNAIGQEIDRFNQVVSNNNITKINSPGMYIISILNKKGSVETHKVIKY